MTEDAGIQKILCPFCSAPWTEENIRIYDVDAADQCASGRIDPVNVSISIVCHSCNRLMYKKDGFEAGY